MHTMQLSRAAPRAVRHRFGGRLWRFTFGEGFEWCGNKENEIFEGANRDDFARRYAGAIRVREDWTEDCGGCVFFAR